MTTPKNVYVGKRYIPKQCGDWDNSKNTEYESLSVVLYQGSSFTSKQDVPKGIDITDNLYWVRSADYNAQVEIYRQNVAQGINTINENFNTFTNGINQDFNNFKDNVNQNYSNFTVEEENKFNTFKDGVNSELTKNKINLRTSEINIMFPPLPLIGAKGDGTEESTIIQNIINFAQENNYGTVYFPKPSVTYKCNNSITVDITKISIIGELSEFDFSNMVSGNCFILTDNEEFSYDNRFKLKHKFEGIVINKKNNDYTQLPITGIFINGNVEVDNFTIERCAIMSCEYGITLGEHCWRLKVDNCLFMWNGTHIYANGNDTAENNHFTSCIFADGGEITLNTDCVFDKCSFDNVAFIQIDSCSKINNSHFEIISPIARTISYPFIDVRTNIAGVICTNVDFNINSNIKFTVPYFNVVGNGSSEEKGLTFNNCSIALDEFFIDLQSFYNSKNPIVCVSGNGRVRANNIKTMFSGQSSSIPFAKQLNKIFNGDAEHSSGYIPFTNNGGGTVTIDTSRYYKGSKSFKFHLPAGVASDDFFIDIPVESGQLFICSYLGMLKTYTSGGSINTFLNYIYPNGALSDTLSYSSYSTPSDDFSSGNYQLFTIIPQGINKIRLTFQLNNPSNAEYKDFWLDEIVVNSI